MGETVLEYRPLSYFYRELGYRWLVFYWGFNGVLYVALFAKYWLRRRVDLAELMVVSFYVFFANHYARGIMFALTVLPFYAGKSLLEMRSPELRSKVSLRAVAAALLVLFLGLFTYGYRQSPASYKPGVASNWVSPWYPTGLVTFMKATGLKGPMYNYYTWGGFLIWSLYPDYQVFADGRALHEPINVTADVILQTFPGWNTYLDAYGINIIAVPVIYRESGHIIPLAMALAYDANWELVYVGRNSALFVRNVPGNQEVIVKYRKDRRNIFKEIIRSENILLSFMPWHPTYNIGKADALFALGAYEQAKAIYERFPAQSAQKLLMLKSMGY
ncbi:MAG: hypothetical protein Kow0025_07480 [Thermodesulfovibrionales bacterium]